jgi:glycerol-3-phosphate dehydrogenase
MRLLFLNAKSAVAIAPLVVELMAYELGKDADWIKAQLDEFNTLAQAYYFK